MTARRKTASARKPALGTLPEWNLADLYPALDAPQLKRDLDRADSYCVAFEEAFRGKLIDLAAGHSVHGPPDWFMTVGFSVRTRVPYMRRSPF